MTESKTFVNNIIAASLATLLLAAVYSNLPSFRFAIIDDAWMLLGNKASHPDVFDLKWLKDAFTDYNNAQYSPVVTIYFALIFKVNGFDPYYFHMGSLLLHLVNGFFLYLLSKKILDSFKINNAKIISYFTCLIWLVHPINMEATVWISAVKFALYSLFIIPSFIFYIEGIKTAKHRYFLLSIILFIFACLSKEQAIVAPFFFIAFTLCLSFTREQNGSTRWIWYSSALVLITFIFLYVTVTADNAVYRHASFYPIYYRLIFAFRSLLVYVGNLIIPWKLKIYTPFPIPFEKPLPAFYLIFPPIFTILFLSAGYFFYLRKKLRFFIFCTLFFFINIGLCLQIIPMGVRTNMLAFRYMYLSGITIVYLILSAFLDKINNSKIAVLSLYILGIAIYSYMFLPDWSVLDIK